MSRKHRDPWAAQAEALLRLNGAVPWRKARHGMLWRLPSGDTVLIHRGGASTDPRAGKNLLAAVRRALTSMGDLGLPVRWNPPEADVTVEPPEGGGPWGAYDVVARADGREVGRMGVDWWTEDPAAGLFVGYVWVDEDWRRRGVGSAIYTAAMTEAARRGSYLGSGAMSDDAIRVWRSLMERGAARRDPETGGYRSNPTTDERWRSFGRSGDAWRAALEAWRAGQVVLPKSAGVFNSPDGLRSGSSATWVLGDWLIIALLVRPYTFPDGDMRHLELYRTRRFPTPSVGELSPLRADVQFPIWRDARTWYERDDVQEAVASLAALGAPPGC